MSNHNANVPRHEAVHGSAAAKKDVEWMKSHLLKTLRWKRYKGDGYGLCRYVAYKLDALYCFDHCRTAVLNGSPVLVCDASLQPGDDLSGPREFAELFDFDLMVSEGHHRRRDNAATLMFVPRNHSWN